MAQFGWREPAERLPCWRAAVFAPLLQKRQDGPLGAVRAHQHLRKGILRHVATAGTQRDGRPLYDVRNHLKRTKAELGGCAGEEERPVDRGRAKCLQEPPSVEYHRRTAGGASLRQSRAELGGPVGCCAPNTSRIG
eukprot:scaffold7079_cov128-Isochrysis_galbana.AAC.3